MTRADVKDYIEEALETWKGQYHPRDPRFRIGEGRRNLAVHSLPAKDKPILDSFLKLWRVL
jgi:hypothetical protein